MVANLAVGDRGARLQNHAGGLMARHERRGHVVLAVHATQIGSAHAGGFDLDTHLAGSQVALRELDIGRQTHGVFGRSFKNQSLHPASVAHAARR